MYALYSFFLFLVLVIKIPVYFFKLTVLRGEKIHLRERLGRGLPTGTSKKTSVWIHAVSVGEVLSLQNLVKKLRKGHPDWEINFSVVTHTGFRIAREKLPEVDRVFFVPLDFARVAGKFFRALNPRVFILAESEFWPNLLREARRNAAAVLLINGRVSERSFRKYLRLKPIALKVLKNIDFFLVQSELDKRRLEEIGVPREKVEKAGNLKCETELPLMNKETLSRLRTSLGIPEGKKIFTAGSTRRGEEEPLLEAFNEARNRRKDIAFILAPRHPERCEEVERICRGFGLSVRRRTAECVNTAEDVILLDTMGELARFYALADATFIGGSLVPWGGHNLLEPAFYGKPIFFGPHMKNFAFLAGEFTRAQAAKVVRGKSDLVGMFLLDDETDLREMGNRAKEVLNSLQGATEKTLQVIEAFMSGG